MVRHSFVCAYAVVTLLACTRSTEVAANPPPVAAEKAERQAEVRTDDEVAEQAEKPAPVAKAEPQEAVLPAPAVAPADAADAGEPWTTTASRTTKPGRPAELQAIRAAAHEGTDRVVFEFEGSLPGYSIEYVDKPLRHCASGMEIPLAGDAWLEVRFQPAQAHNEAGEVTVGELRRRPGLPVVRELAQTCDFEGDVTWAIGTSTPARFRVLELSSPTRLVIDLKR